MANWNFSAKMGAPVTQYNETEDARIAGGAGGVVGKMVGDVLDAKMAQDKQAKVQDLVNKYNQKFPPFGTEVPSNDTLKLAQLLLPLDADLAQKYMAQGNAEKAKETQLAQNKRIVEAGKAVPTSREEALPQEQITSMDDEIRLITTELHRREQAPDVSMGMPKPDIPTDLAPRNRDFSRYTPSFNPWSGNTGIKSDMIQNRGNG